jgi:putative ABC transport system permease protein
MLEAVLDLWDGLSNGAQDAVTLVALLVPMAVLAVWLSAGYAPARVVTALMRRYLWVNVVFAVLISLSVAMSVGLLAQERALREGSALAARKFPMIVSAPGSELTIMFAAVFLDPTAVPLLRGDAYNALATHPRARFAAPLAFGDSYRGAPVIGTTADFAEHLSDGAIDGRLFETPYEAISGAALSLPLGHTFTPAHGLGDSAEEGLHDDIITIVGRLPPTGSPWDRAILTPVEGVWLIHAMGDGHGGDGSKIGPPYDPVLFPGTPAAIVVPRTLPDAYALQAEFNSRTDAMAFFPGTVLAELYNVMGDVRGAMSVMATLTQGLVAASVLVGLFMLARLYRPQLVLLRTLGAPARFIVAIVWWQAALLLLLGAALGLGLGVGAAAILSQVVSAETGIAISAQLGWPELHLAAGFVTLVSIASVVLGLRAVRHAREAR